MCIITVLYFIFYLKGGAGSLSPAYVMANYLQTEEQIIVDTLRQYGCLKKSQITKMIHYKEPELVERILVGLSKRQAVFLDECDNVKIDIRCDYSYQHEVAFWILLKYIMSIRPSEHYAANYPSQIYFLKDRNQYEIVVLRDGEDYLLGPLSNSDRTTGEDEDESDEIRYIIAIPSETMINVCKSRMKGKKLLFAVYDPEFVSGTEPAIKFIKSE